MPFPFFGDLFQLCRRVCHFFNETCQLRSLQSCYELSRPSKKEEHLEILIIKTLIILRFCQGSYNYKLLQEHFWCLFWLMWWQKKFRFPLRWFPSSFVVLISSFNYYYVIVHQVCGYFWHSNRSSNNSRGWHSWNEVEAGRRGMLKKCWKFNSVVNVFNVWKKFGA